MKVLHFLSGINAFECDFLDLQSSNEGLGIKRNEG